MTSLTRPSPTSTSPTATSSPCAACKFLRRKCQPDCVFAPYFHADQPQKFISVHRVFGASNVTKLLKEIAPKDREDAVNSLAYEADMRIRDPVYGCVGVISILNHELRKLQIELSFARSELARFQLGYPVQPVEMAGQYKFGFDETMMTTTTTSAAVVGPGMAVGFGVNVGGRGGGCDGFGPA